jgi:hypothetical protein
LDITGDGTIPTLDYLIPFDQRVNWNDVVQVLHPQRQQQPPLVKPSDHESLNEADDSGEGEEGEEKEKRHRNDQLGSLHAIVEQILAHLENDPILSQIVPKIIVADLFLGIRLVVHLTFSFICFYKLISN